MSLIFPPYAYHTTFPTYTSDEEYRFCIRQVFQMNKAIYQPKVEELREHIGDDLDAVTEDELSFDEDAMKRGMDYIYLRTKKNPLFQQIYKDAAAKMISMDPEIGLAVCFSYDYFDTFHACLSLYLENPDSFQESSETFKKMILRLSE